MHGYHSSHVSNKKKKMRKDKKTIWEDHHHYQRLGDDFLKFFFLNFIFWLGTWLWIRNVKVAIMSTFHFAIGSSFSQMLRVKKFSNLICCSCLSCYRFYICIFFPDYWWHIIPELIASHCWGYKLLYPGIFFFNTLVLYTIKWQSNLYSGLWNSELLVLFIYPQKLWFYNLFATGIFWFTGKVFYSSFMELFRKIGLMYKLVPIAR